MNDVARREEARPGRHQSGSVIGLAPEAAGAPLPDDPSRPLPARCPLPGPFATATAVQPAAAGEWAASIHPGWDIAGNANGGYLLAVAARALADATGHPDPVTVTAHYLSPGRPGSVRIAAQVLKEGRRFATGTATMFAGARPLLAVLGTFEICHRPRVPSSLRARPLSCPRPSSASACIRPGPSRPRSWAGSTCGCTPMTPPSPPGASPDTR